MNRFLPNMYAKDIHSINYKKLKQKKVKALLFDLDNTLIEKGNYEINKDKIKLINELKKDFIIYIVSNSINTKKLNKVSQDLEVPYIKNSKKPFKKGFKKLKFKSIKNNQIAMIGDQILTDVLGGNRMGYITILIDPISKKEHIMTKINRKIENKISKKIKVKRGSYYD